MAAVFIPDSSEYFVVFSKPEARGLAARNPKLYPEVVLKEKSTQSQDGFIPLGALAKANGRIAPAPKPEAPPQEIPVARSIYEALISDNETLTDPIVAQMRKRANRQTQWRVLEPVLLSAVSFQIESDGAA